MKKNIRKILRIILVFVVLTTLSVLLVVLVSNSVINIFANDYLYNDVNKIPQNKAGVLLGTSKYLGNGTPNLFFIYRINAAAELYNSGKIEYIIISGDNSTLNYNEPQLMKKELVKRGIPENKIILDYAGFRTYDSMIRAKEIFGQNKFTVISQKFHNQRAVYIARKYGIDAIGYNAKDVSSYIGLKTMIREKFARVKVFIDIFTGKAPKFLGEKIIIETNNLETIGQDTIK